MIKTNLKKKKKETLPKAAHPLFSRPSERRRGNLVAQKGKMYSGDVAIRDGSSFFSTEFQENTATRFQTYSHKTVFPDQNKAPKSCCLLS